MKTNKPMLVISVLFVLLHSCVKTVDNSGTQSVNKQWLQNLACTFPCWQYITPQETNFEDVLSILQDAKIKVDFVDEDDISFLFEGTISGSVSKASDGTVDHIILDIHGEKLSVDDLAQVIGTPERISLTYEGYTSDCRAALLYPSSGAILDVYLENDSKSKNILDCQVDLTSDSQIFRIVLISSKLNNSEFWKRSSYSGLNYMEWKGYGEYP